MSSETLPNFGLPQVAIPSPNKYTPEYWVNKPHPHFGFLELQARDGLQRGWVQFMPPQGFLIFGRDMAAAHIFVGHPSVSNQHAVAAWDVRDGKCYIIDLESEHGTFVHDQVIEHSVPYELRPGARVRFGQSSHVYIFNNLPPELVDPNQEAPVSDRDRGVDPGKEVSKPPFEEGFSERFDARSEHRPEFDRQPRPLTPPFRGNGPPERDPRGPPPDPRGPPPDLRGPPPDLRGPPPDLRGPPPDRGRPMDLRGPPPDVDRRMDRRNLPPERWSPPQRRFEERRPEGPRGGPGPGRRMPPPRQSGRRPEGPGPGPGPGRGRGMSPESYDNRRPDGPGPGPGPGRDRSPQRFDARRPDGHGRGMTPPIFNDRMRFDGPPRSPPPPRGRGRGSWDGPRSPPPRGRGSPHDMRSPRGRGRTPPRRDYR